MSSSSHPSVVILLGTVFLAAGIYLGYNQYRFVSAAQPAVGHVIDQKRLPVRGDNHVPVIQFRIAGGQMVRFQVYDARQGAPFFVGQEIPVLYLVVPGHPTVVKKYSWFHLWEGPMIFTAVGIGLFAIVLTKPHAGSSD